MNILHPRCAALDVHKKSVTVCARTRINRCEYALETAQFGTYTEDLEQLAQWLHERKVRHVAMESTGVCWKPERTGGGAMEVRTAADQSATRQVVAGPIDRSQRRRSHRRVFAARLVARQFRATPAATAVRELTRRRAHLQGDRNRVINRIRRLLETANVKLGSAVSNVVGKTGTAILRAIAAGESDPEWLATRCSAG